MTWLHCATLSVFLHTQPFVAHKYRVDPSLMKDKERKVCRISKKGVPLHSHLETIEITDGAENQKTEKDKNTS
jgi:hypothetical protein